MRVKDLVARGKSIAEARRIARAEIETWRASWTNAAPSGVGGSDKCIEAAMFDEITRDVAFAVRLLPPAPVVRRARDLHDRARYRRRDVDLLGCRPKYSFAHCHSAIRAGSSPCGSRSLHSQRPVIARLASRTVLGAEEFYALREGATSFKSIAL